jgi:chaperonin GroES
VKLQALSDNVIVRPEPEHYAGVVHLLEQHARVLDRGVVVSVGEGKPSPQGYWLPTSLQPGDVVVFQRQAGHLTRIDGEQLRVMTEDDVFGRLVG